MICGVEIGWVSRGLYDRCVCYDGRQPEQGTMPPDGKGLLLPVQAVL